MVTSRGISNVAVEQNGENRLDRKRDEWDSSAKDGIRSVYKAETEEVIRAYNAR